MKFLLIGGVGNQLFVLARALTIGNDVAVIKHFGQSHNIFLQKIGVSVHRDWLGIEQIAKQHKLVVKKVNLIDIIELAVVLLVKKILKLNWDQCEQRTILNWNLGYFHSSEKTSCEAVLSIAKSIDTFLIDLNDIPAAESVVHNRQGDMPEKFRLTSDEILNFRLNVDPTAYIIEAAPTGKNVYKETSDSEIYDFNLIRGSKNVLFGASTFAFWAVIASKNLNEKKIWVKAIYVLRKNISRFSKNVQDS